MLGPWPVWFALGVVIGVIAARVNLYFRPRVIQRIDRAFFRSVYDVQQVLTNLARKSREARDRDELAALLRNEIVQALHPVSMAVYFRSTGGQLGLHGDGTDSRWAQVLSPAAPVLQELSRHRCLSSPFAVRVEWQAKPVA